MSTQRMTEDDLRAIAIYLNDLDDEPRAALDAPTEAVMEAGEALYFDNCAACHVSDGSGVDHIFARLDGSNKVNSDDATTIIRVVLEGAHAEPTDARPAPIGMPAFGWKLSDREIADLLSYVRNAWNNSAPAIGEDDVAALRDLLSDQ